MFSALLGLALTTPSQAFEASTWEGTRWQLAVESVLPVEVNLLAKTNEEFILKAIQLRTTVSCNETEAVGKNLVVRCDFDDVAIQATPHGESPSTRELQNSQIVIEDVRDTLKDSTLEVQFNKFGRITRVDVGGIEGDNTREKWARERMRQLVTDLVMGWSFKAPKEWTGNWPEMNSPIFRAPGVSAATGTSSAVHVANEVNGQTVVQSQGSGIASVYYEPWEFQTGNKVARNLNTTASGSSSGGGTVPSYSATRAEGLVSQGGASAVTGTPETTQYDVSLRSVAVVDPETGLVQERVWSVVGQGTASSVGSFQGVNLWYNGHIRKLDAETPDLGPTQIVSQPGQNLEGLPMWQPMDE